MLALLVAALRYQSPQPNLDDPGLLAHYNDRGWVELEGVVDGYPDVRDTWTNLKVEAESIEVEGERRRVRGTVLIRAPRFPAQSLATVASLRPDGNTTRVRGLFVLRVPRAKGHLLFRELPADRQAQSGQGNPFWAALYSVKDLARDALARLVPDPEASLLQGILLGIRSGIPNDLYEDYNTTGTSHIIVISGSNITFIATLFALAFSRLLGPRRAYWLIIAGITLYVLLVGADAAVVRAGLMDGLFVTAIALGGAPPPTSLSWPRSSSSP